MRKFFVLLILLGSFSVSAATADLNAIFLNRQAKKLMQEQRFDQALEKLAQALATSPDVPEIHLNMGLVFEALGQSEKAIQAFRTAAELADSPDMQFVARFNEGSLYQKAKKTDEALTAYHAALDVNPGSSETKINIELLIQQQQQQGKGEGQGDQNKDQKDQNQKGQGQNQDGKDEKDQKGQGDQNKEDKPKEYAKNKPQPRPFKSEELNQADVNKILGELRNQEQHIRSEYNKREVKEKPRDKDW